MGWVRDRSLGLFFLALFVLTWLGQLVFQAAEFIDEQTEHGSSEFSTIWDSLADADFWESFWQSTLENWQSEFLQVGSFVIGAAYLVYKGSSESKDGEERIEALLNAVAEKVGVSPADVYADLPEHLQPKQ
jgi:hypothetical protein